MLAPRTHLADAEQLLQLSLDDIGNRLRRFRLVAPAAEEAMTQSVRRYGQLSPVVVFRHEDSWQLIDGYKRHAAAQYIDGLETLWARALDVDDRTAKVAMCTLNQRGRGIGDLEEAWIVRALVREDGLNQFEVAQLLGKHKSWVSRRLALVERLCDEALEDLQVGLLSPTTARELLRLPRGNQAEALAAVRRDDLTRNEARGVVDLLLDAGDDQVEKKSVLADPREALARHGAAQPPGDARSSGGDWLVRQVGMLLEVMPRVENLLRGRQRRTAASKDALVQSLGRLRDQCAVLAEAIQDRLERCSE